ncbi:MAG: hypothetical protein JW800_02085, partial [Candidatus Omnitrophica bacterium]|nr:hypothetical protein [Candidatus Omnitrophota bacterium]
FSIELDNQFRDLTDKKIRIHNLSRPAHTSLDSKIKMELLKDKALDFIIFYHGINDVRANNCPQEGYRDDYTHYDWYEEISVILRHRDNRYSAIPFFSEYSYIKMRKRLGFDKYLPLDRPREDWIAYGGDVKTRGSFRDNLLDIIKIAESKSTPILIMTYGYYIPENYSLEMFNNGEVEYNLFSFPIELWGDPENVKAGIEAHNEVVRAVEGEVKYGKLYFLDTEKLLKKDYTNFNDVCHLTHNGVKIMVANMMPFIQEVINE